MKGHARGVNVEKRLKKETCKRYKKRTSKQNHGKQKKSEMKQR